MDFMAGGNKKSCLKLEDNKKIVFERNKVING